MKLLVATRNRGKQAEFRRLLAPYVSEIVFPDELGLVEHPDEAVLEVHDTFEDNALVKANWFAERSGLQCLADDSGIEVDALGGAPGVHSRRFSGVPGPDHIVAAANNAELLRRLEGMPDHQRTARYRGVLVLTDHAGSHIANGVTEGRVLHAPRGSNGFGYDPVFYSSELGCSLAQADDEQKSLVSHRARAVLQMFARRPR